MDRLACGLLRLLGSVGSALVLCAIVLLFAFGAYAIWDVMDVVEAASPAQYEEFKPTQDGGPSFEELKAANPDVFGWVAVYGTNVDYPLLQGEDNEKYLKTSPQGRYAMSGSVFLDYRNSKSFTDFNHVVYGHHMSQHAMFGDIGEFEDKAFFESHPYGELYAGGRTYGIEFFAFDVADVYETGLFEAAVTGERQQAAYLSEVMDGALHKRDVGVTAQDRLVLLTTCVAGSLNDRHLLVGRLTDTVFEDTFAKADGKEARRPVATVDGVLAENGDIAQALMLGLVLLVLVLAAAVAARVRRDNGSTRRQ